MDQTLIWDFPDGHCGLSIRHIVHRFVDPCSGLTYRCHGWRRPPVGFAGYQRDPADAPQLRHAPGAPLTAG